jgi:hypothetical protein
MTREQSLGKRRPSGGDLPGPPEPTGSGTVSAQRASRLLNTRTLGAAAVSLGGGLAGTAVLAPTAQACWSANCRTYVSQSVHLNSREYGPWNQYSGQISSNHAHYYDCVQSYVYASGVSKHYTNYACGRSPYRSGTAYTYNQGLAWREALSWAPGCGHIWGREIGSKLQNSRHIYGAC